MTMAMTKTKRFAVLLLAVLTLISCFTISASAATTSWKPIVKNQLSAPQANTEQYQITLGWFTTSKKVTLGSSMKFNSLYGTTTQDAKCAANLARFDVTVQYNGKNACYIQTYRGLRAGDSFTLANKVWNESKTYTITVRSYMTSYSNFGTLFCNYQMKY